MNLSRLAVNVLICMYSIALGAYSLSLSQSNSKNCSLPSVLHHQITTPAAATSATFVSSTARYCQYPDSRVTNCLCNSRPCSFGSQSLGIPCTLVSGLLLWAGPLTGCPLVARWLPIVAYGPPTGCLPVGIEGLAHVPAPTHPSERNPGPCNYNPASRVRQSFHYNADKKWL